MIVPLTMSTSPHRVEDDIHAVLGRIGVRLCGIRDSQVQQTDRVDVDAGLRIEGPADLIKLASSHGTFMHRFGSHKFFVTLKPIPASPLVNMTN